MNGAEALLIVIVIVIGRVYEDDTLTCLQLQCHTLT